MVYYKIPLTGGLDYPAGSILICSYTYNEYQYCKFERVTEVGSGWVSITEAEFNVRCPEFPEPEYSGEIESTEHPGCFYRMIDGEKEWINPPMVANNHYRTMERCDGKPVYVAHVYVGSEVLSECLIGNNIRAIRASGYLVYDNGYRFSLPYKTQNVHWCLNVRTIPDQGGTELYASLYSDEQERGFNCYAQVWYINE